MRGLVVIVMGFFVFWGQFLINLHKWVRYFFFLQKWIKSLGRKTTLKMKSSSPRPVSLFFFKQVMSLSRITFCSFGKSEVVVLHDFTFSFFFVLFFFYFHYFFF